MLGPEERTIYNFLRENEWVRYSRIRTFAQEKGIGDPYSILQRLISMGRAEEMAGRGQSRDRIYRAR